MSQKQNNVTFEGFNAPGAQITVNGLLQLTPNTDGSVTIDLGDGDIEVERTNGSRRMVIRRANPAAEPSTALVMEPAKTKVVNA